VEQRWLNQHPIQDIYVREAYQDDTGNITNRVIGTVLEDHQDAYVGECGM